LPSIKNRICVVSLICFLFLSSPHFYYESCLNKWLLCLMKKWFPNFFCCCWKCLYNAHAAALASQKRQKMFLFCNSLILLVLFSLVQMNQQKTAISGTFVDLKRKLFFAKFAEYIRFLLSCLLRQLLLLDIFRYIYIFVLMN
jgi:hypothetical protein